MKAVEDGAVLFEGSNHVLVTHGFPVAWPPVLDHSGGWAGSPML